MTDPGSFLPLEPILITMSLVFSHTAYPSLHPSNLFFPPDLGILFLKCSLLAYLMEGVFISLKSQLWHTFHIPSYLPDNIFHT